MTQPIDAVVTWVNGDDPAHRAKREAYLATLGQVPTIASDNRFQESGEFAYCIASLLRFAPWLRRIFIVTDNQRPAFMSDVEAAGMADRIVIVDHAEVFQGYVDCLPTFNIRSLISVLWRVPGLAKRFIFLNDDFLLIGPVSPEDFFRDDQMVLRGHWEVLPWLRLDKRILSRLGSQEVVQRAMSRPGNREAQARSAKLAGCQSKYFRVPHNPHPQLRELTAEWVDENRESFRHNIGFRLRSQEQFLMDALTAHLALLSGRAVVDNRLKTLRLRMDALSRRGLRMRTAWADRQSAFRFACLQSLEQASPAVRSEAMDWIKGRIGTLDEQLAASGQRGGAAQ